MKKLECIHTDTCLSSYWSGHHLPHIQIPVYKGMTVKAVKESICAEIGLGQIAGTQYGNLLTADYLTNDKDIEFVEGWYKKAYAAINRIASAVKHKKTLFNDLEETSCDDCGETVYAFFVFKEVD
ncbi:hypothetical protein [Alishewanella phage vB_AspM_Slickus01]|nr:hypothetical protein [Alishewanella phage vB_AspM_Slickus01]